MYRLQCQYSFENINNGENNRKVINVSVILHQKLTEDLSKKRLVENSNEIKSSNKIYMKRK